MLAAVLCSLVIGISLVIVFAQKDGTPNNSNTPERPRQIESQNSNQATPKVDRGGLTQDPRPAGKTEPVANESEAPFYAALRQRGVKIDGICPKDDPVAKRVLEDYGAIFVAREIVIPTACMFLNDSEVLVYQESANPRAATIGGTTIYLQTEAMLELLAARREANAAGLDITPRGGSEAARRSYQATFRLWNSRFQPALAHWQGRGRITGAQAARLRSLPIHDQVTEVLELEKSGTYFSTGFDKSILYSVAAPGTSQHIMMLALDVAQFGDARVRQILARHGWFQTVKSDLPHFTFLGLEEKDLPQNGLRSMKVGSQTFWIPNVEVPAH